MNHPGPQAILAGKYRLVRQLGKGGMGSVWLAQHLTLESPVAIKLIDPAIAETPEALSRFMREAKAAASLRSPHVVQILDHGVDDATPYIAMEVLEGETLAQRLERLGRLAPAETARILTHVARALSRAHETGIVHRDLKPENIFIVRNDEEEIAKVLDFGIAKSTLGGLGASASGSTRTGALLGTPYYMSPEQAEGVRTVDHRTDVWAMGVIAFECIVGRRPFDAETIGSLLLAICSRPLPIPSQMGAVPAEFDVWFARVCARDVAQRTASAKEATAELRRICGEGGAVDSGGTASRRPDAPLASPRISAQSVVGLSSTHRKSVDSIRGSGRGFRVALGVAALAAIGGGIWAWMRLDAGGAVSAAPTSQTLVTSAPVKTAEPPVPSPAVPPPVAELPASAPVAPAAAPRAVAVTALSKVSPPAAPPGVAMSRPAQPPSPKPSPPVTTVQPASKVNLGF
jgi:serine/threonine-protein kinase